jgi:SpoVK/Ycf46/Vps4 family AAA+-type ATPase
MIRICHGAKYWRLMHFVVVIICMFYFSSSHAANSEIDFKQLSISGKGDYVDKLVREIIRPLKKRGESAKKSINPARGLLLYGPPGNGKTEIAIRLDKLIPNAHTIFHNSPGHLSKGDTEASTVIKNSFKQASNNPSKFYIIIFDEIDTLGKRRSNKDLNRCPLEQLLISMDGNERLANVLVVGITNNPQDLDDALIRAGRLEIYVEIPFPDKNDRALFFIYFLKKGGAAYSEDIDFDGLASDLSDDYSPADIRLITEMAGRCAYEDTFKKDENDEKDILIQEGDRDPIITENHLKKACMEMDKDRKHFKRLREGW